MEDLKSIRRSLQLLCVIAAFVTAYFAKDLILPVLLGFLMALTLSPLSRALTRAGLPSGLAAALIVGLAGTLVLVIVGVAGGTIALWSDELPQMGSRIQSKLAGLADTVETVRRATEEVQNMGDNGGTAREVTVQQPGIFSSVMSTGVTLGGTLAVMLVLAMFLLASGNMFYVKLVQSFQRLEDKKRALAAVYEVEQRVSRYLLTITLINAGLGFFIWAWLFALGVPNAHVFGVAGFLLNFLPYIGGVIGAMIAGAYALISFDTVGYAMLAPIGYMVLTTFEGQFVTPWMIGKRLEMNTVAVFLTVVLWGWLWGIAGALIAVPFLVVFKVVCENVQALHIFSNFLDDRRGDLPEQTLKVKKTRAT